MVWAEVKSPVDTTLFVGSGFSVPAGLPTMSQFALAFRRAYESRQLPLEAAPWLERLDASEIAATMAAVYYAEHTAQAPRPLAQNVEWVLAQLDILIILWNETWRMATFRPEDDFRFVSARETDLSVGACYESVRSGLLKVYRHPLREITRASPLARLVRRLKPSQIITTNYDRVVEKVLTSLGIAWHHLGTELTPPDDAVRVIKLHGDTLWEEEETPIWGLRPETERQEPRVNTVWAVEPIVLPTWIRRPPSPGLRNIWRNALRAITECEHLVILGFGLPATDQHVAHLLTAALSGARGEELVPRRITLVNPDIHALGRLLTTVPARFRQRVAVFPVAIEEWYAL